LIDSQLQDVNIPLRYQLFFGADKHHFAEIEKIQHDVVGIKVFMGCSTGNLVIDDDESLERIFDIAGRLNLLVAVHAEDERHLKERNALFVQSKNYADHSLIRNEEVARIAVEKAINHTKRFGTKLYILHTSTKDELTLIKQAKKDGLPVYAESTPHHLFLTTNAYQTLNGKAVVNPPLRDELHQDALWQAVLDGTIDTIGSDHAPHLESEKQAQYGICPSGMPGIETTLSLLLTAYHEKKISLQRIIELTSARAKTIFNLPTDTDHVLVDLNKEYTVLNNNLQTKCQWSPFAGQILRGRPQFVVLKNKLYDLNTLKEV
jgi:dihydroorotase